MAHFPPITEMPDKIPANKYANKKPPHYYFKVSGVEPYSGPWNRESAKHLLRRCLFGHTQEDIDLALQKGLSRSITDLLTYQLSYTLPINDYYDQISDPDCDPEEAWVDKPFTLDPIINNARNRSFQSWWLGEMTEQGFSIQEKMTLFWHNHFATQISTVNFSSFTYGTNKLLRENCLGNFKQLVKAVTLDAGMLLYLNGYRNQKNRPDENYARELQELFTLGKGPESQYTEDDVREAARILTGWTFNQSGGVTYQPFLHDTGNKQFSSFYGNQIIQGNADANVELDALLDMIFSKQEVSKFICRKLYRFFVYYVIDEEIEEKVIEPLALTFRQNNYEILPVLEQLFQSAHFFDPYTKGAIIKNPMDFLVGHFKQAQIDTRKNTPTERSETFYMINVLSLILQMQLGEPPNVAGWSAYYQAPQYHEHWINSVTLPKRNQIADAIMILPNGLRLSGVSLVKDVLILTESIPNAADPNLLIEYWADFIFAKGLSDEEKATLKSILLYGQAEDYYWTIAWNEYINDKQNTEKRNTAYYLLYGFYKRLFNLPEYQLS